MKVQESSCRCRETLYLKYNILQFTLPKKIVQQDVNLVKYGLFSQINYEAE